MRTTVGEALDLASRQVASAKEEAAAQHWRRARTPRDAWRLFSRWLSRTEPDEDTSDAPYWDTEMHGHTVWTGPKAKQLVLFEKRRVMESFLPDGRGSTRAERWGVATHVVPFAPNPWDVRLIKHHARLIGGPAELSSRLRTRHRN